MDNIGHFLFEIFDRLLECKDTLTDFLFTEVSIFTYDFSVWQLLAGGGLIVFLTAVIVKCFI